MVIYSILKNRGGTYMLEIIDLLIDIENKYNSIVKKNETIEKILNIKSKLSFQHLTETTPSRVIEYLDRILEDYPNDKLANTLFRLNSHYLMYSLEDTKNYILDIFETKISNETYFILRKILKGEK